MKRRVSSRNEFIGTLLVLITAISSGVAIIVNKFFVAKMDPLVLTSLRGFFVGIIFLLIALYVMAHNREKSFKKTSWGPLLLIGIIGGGLAFWLFFSGLKLTLGVRAAFLHKTLPIYALILAFVFLKERITKKHIMAMSVMFLGLLIMELPKLSWDVRVGDLLVLGATVLWAIENTISKRAMLNRESNWVVVFSRMFFGSIVLFAIIFLLGKIDMLFLLTQQQMVYVLISGLFLLVYVLTYYWGLKYINLSKAATILLLSPVVSLILGVLWLGESVAVVSFIGAFLILVGAYFIIGLRSESREV
jgi:drug/metabolite transporter (DMT)-like permease